MMIYFLGTSNFIISSSAFYPFREMVKEEISNYSVGASPSSTAMYLLGGISFNPGDIFFLDYAVNDNSYLANLVCSQMTVVQNIASVVEYLSERGAIPIVVINPELIGLEVPTGAELAHVAACRVAGAYMLNLAKLFRLTVNAGALPLQLMVDEAHQSAKVAPFIASVLIDAVNFVRSQPARVSRPDIPLRSFRTIAAAELVGEDRRIVRSSSLRSSNMAILTHSQGLDLALNAREAVAGVMVNIGASGAIMEVSGELDGFATTLVGHWDNRNPYAYLSIFVEFSRIVRGGQNGVQLRILDQDAKVTEPAIHRRFVDLDLYGEIHLEGILVTSERPLVGEPTFAAKPLADLLEGKYDSMINTLKTLTA